MSIALYVFSFVSFFFVLYSSFGDADILMRFKYIFVVLFVLLVCLLIYVFRKYNIQLAAQVKLKAKVEEGESKLENILAAANNKSYYLHDVSHEMRTPLNNMIGMLNMLKETNLDSDQLAEVEIAHYSSKHLLQLVNMILDNHRFDADTIELHTVVMDLESDLLKLFKVFEYQAWDKNLEFEYTFLSDKKSKFSLLGDLSRIKQILVNLFNNALKFTESGKITITIHQASNNDHDQIVTFYVKDTGKGMSSKTIANINHVNIEKDLSEMSGVGLSIAHRIVKTMGGELEIESKEGEGSVFCFTLQLKKTLSLKVDNNDSNTVLLKDLDYKCAALIAEDNRIHQKVIKFLLEQQGVDCTFVKNGLEAVKLYNILDFDIVFMDIYMPDMDGHEATKIIKNTDKYASNKIPVIAVSAGVFEADIENAKLSGVDDFLAKPIEANKLKTILNKYTLNK